MPENLIYMDAPLGRTYGYRGVQFTSMRPFAVSEEDAKYLVAVLKGDGHPLFVRGKPPEPALGEDGQPLPPVDAVALQAEQERNEAEVAGSVQDMVDEEIAGELPDSPRVMKRKVRRGKTE